MKKFQYEEIKSNIIDFPQTSSTLLTVKSKTTIEYYSQLKYQDNSDYLGLILLFYYY
jgi:hypothetical protein